jgi:cytochrome c
MNRKFIALLAFALPAHAALAQQAGDPVAGAVVFQQCAMCHEVGPTAKNSQGPVLNGLIGRPAGSYPGYAYSPQNQSLRVKWDVATLTKYLKDPKGYVPGTKMFFKGLSSPKDIADVIAYVAQFDAQGNTKQP